jgi:type VI secretion system protein ImpA
VSEQAEALLARTKDLRPVMLMLRATTRLRGVAGFNLGLQLLNSLLERFWDGIHPMLDADDDNDPTMRLNALAPLTDENMVLRDLYDAQVCSAPGVGPIRVRDIAVSHNALAAPPGSSPLSQAQVLGGLKTVHAEHPEAVNALGSASTLLTQLQTVIIERTGRADAIDLAPLRSIGTLLKEVFVSVAGVQAQPEVDAAGAEAGAVDAGAAAPRAAASRGEILTRQDALAALDRVVHYLEQSEPGNPAPLLIQRAKRLIGVSFYDIMADLAPNAMDAIVAVTGQRPPE